MKRRGRRRPFVDLEAAEIAAAGPEAGGLFLGRLDDAALRRELEEAGLLEGLAARGYADVVVRTAVEDGEHRLWIRPRRGSPAGGERVSLVELRLAEAVTVAGDPLLRRHGLDVLAFLAVHWLALQDPRGRFTPERPRLPGQRYPGLGISRRLYERAFGWARAWGKDGLLNFPEYFHNAVFYSSPYRFLSPARQGRFEALRRDLAGLHVAAASRAVDDGRVVEEPADSVVRWEPGEMVAPITDGLRRCLESADYRRAADEAREGVRFRLKT